MYGSMEPFTVSLSRFYLDLVMKRFLAHISSDSRGEGCAHSFLKWLLERPRSCVYLMSLAL